MRNIARTMLLAGLAALVTLGASACGSEGSTAPRSETVAKPIILEDDPRFDCRTMGNKRCAMSRSLDAAVKACTKPTAKVPGFKRPVRLNTVKATDMPACLKLGKKPSRTYVEQGSKVTVASGTTRVVECRMSSRGIELSYCLRQP